MVNLRHASYRLKCFRKSLGITVREAAAQLSVTHVALIGWESGRKTPSIPYRDAIERWTSGVIPTSAWGMTPRDAMIASALANVGPAVPVITDTHPDDSKRPGALDNTSSRRGRPRKRAQTQTEVSPEASPTASQDGCAE